MEGRAPAPRTPAQDHDVNCRVVVTGYPSYTQPQDLSRAFIHFGNVKVERLNPRQATLVFPTTIEAKSVLQANKQVSIYGTLLTVQPYDPTVKEKRSPKKDKKERQLLPALDPKKIDLSGDFHQQLDNIMMRVRLTQQEVASISTLYTDLEQVLQEQWPGCQAVPFGSIPTGLGIKSSDADCFVRVPPPARAQHAHHNHVTKAKRVLLHYPQKFTAVLAIPRANTPIVKLQHVPTRTSADLTFKTELGARNSRLVAGLLHTDPRLLPLAVIVKYWAKVHDLSGSGRLTNYALTLLVVFYLQQKEVGILPSVQCLQAAVEPDLVDYWNVAFGDSRWLLPPGNSSSQANQGQANHSQPNHSQPNNSKANHGQPNHSQANKSQSALPDLIGGFFTFYNNFNFDELMVCPYLGYPVKKELFKDLSTVPTCFDRYKDNVRKELVYPIRFSSSMCVQDPFEQCHNVASTVSSRLAEDLRAYIKFAADAYEQEKPKKCKRFFEILLLQRPKIVRQKGSPEFRANLFPNVIANITEPDWKGVVRKCVFEIFETMLRMKLGKYEEKVNPDTKKEKEKYTGVVPKAIWKRKQFQRLYSVMDLDFVEKNKRITEEILNTDKELVNIQYQLTIAFCNSPRSAVLSVKMAAGDVAAFREFGKFVVSVLQPWFAHVVRPHAAWPALDAETKVAETIRYLDANMAADSDDSGGEASGSAPGSARGRTPPP